MRQTARRYGSLTAVITAALVTGAALFAGCADTPLPGTLLGTYGVTGTLTTNTCGTGVGAPSPWTFNVQMSTESTTLYWSWLDGSAPLSSVLSSSSATLDANETVNVDGTADGGLGPCSLTRADTIVVNLGAGTPPKSFTGSIGYAFSIASGADCSDQLSANGGMYDTLPCSITYTTSATLQ